MQLFRTIPSLHPLKYARQAWHHIYVYIDRVLSRIFCLGGKSILKKIFEPRGGEKNFFRPSRGLRGHGAPENFENIVFRMG